VPDPADVVRSFVHAYDAGSRAEMAALLSADLVGYVTNASAGVDRVDGADAYLARLPDPPDAELSLRVTQSVSVAPDQALTMVEIRASRGQRELHNFGAFLSRVRDGQITEIWMVDALPALSYEFWSSAP
jgi:ketosteroid isomerase-like protein